MTLQKNWIHDKKNLKVSTFSECKKPKHKMYVYVCIEREGEDWLEKKFHDTIFYLTTGKKG